MLNFHLQIRSEIIKGKSYKSDFDYCFSSSSPKGLSKNLKSPTSIIILDCFDELSLNTNRLIQSK